MRNLYIDIETDGILGSYDRLLVVGYAVDDGPVEVLSWFDFQEDEREYPHHAATLRALLADPDVAVVSHTPFDVLFLRRAGFEVTEPYYDTRVMAWVLNENTPLDLEWLTWRYAQVEMDKRLKRHSNSIFFTADDGVETELSEFVNLPWDHPYWMQFMEYNVRDVEALRTLFLELQQRMDESEWTDYWQREEVPYTAVLVRMAERGLPIDLDAVAHLTPVVEEDARRLRLELLEEGGLPDSFKLTSPKQLVAYLFSRVVEFGEAIVYDRETIQCIKSCLDGEHEDCEQWPDTVEFYNIDGTTTAELTRPDLHMRDLLPEGFTLDKLGRDRVHGHWTVKGRGLKPTPHTKNRLTGEEGKLPSTSSPELLYMHGTDPWVRKLCTQFRKAEKLLTTYLRKFPVIAREDDRGQMRVYGSYNQAGTVTGRLSSSGPNMQNMPARGERGKQVRSLFTVTTEDLFLTIGDYDQLEMRIMASLSGDRRLVEVFREGKDPHEMLAHAIFGNVDVLAIAPGAALSYRDAGKQLNYAMGYGARHKKIAQTLSLFGFPTTPDVARGYLSEMERYYHGLFEYNERVIAEAKRKGSVRTLGGRRRRLKAAFKDTANWRAQGYGERQAVNTRIQGTAGDIVRRAMVLVDHTLPWFEMLAQIHDELVGQTRYHPSAEQIAELQAAAETGHGFNLRVPLVFSPTVGKSWAEKGGKSMADLYAFDDEEEEE